MKTASVIGIVLVGVVMPGVCAAVVDGESVPTRIAGAANGQRSKTALRFTPEREAAALTFARNHAPQLSKLLDYLKANRPRQYRRAIVDLFRTSERLATIRQRDPERYALELELWKTKSQIEVLAAQVQVRDSKELRDQLRKAVQELIAMHRAFLVRERDRLQRRLGKLDESIGSLDPDDRAVVDRHLQMFLQQRGRRRPRIKTTQESGEK